MSERAIEAKAETQKVTWTQEKTLQSTQGQRDGVSERNLLTLRQLKTVLPVLHLDEEHAQPCVRGE